VHDGLLVAEQRYERGHDPLVHLVRVRVRLRARVRVRVMVHPDRALAWHGPCAHLARQLHAEGRDELDRVGHQDGVRRRRRLQLG
jgi:hypothetical protein